MSALFVFTQEGSSVKSKSFLHANSLVQNFFSVVDLSIFNSKSKNSLYSRFFEYRFPIALSIYSSKSYRLDISFSKNSMPSEQLRRFFIWFGDEVLSAYTAMLL